MENASKALIIAGAILISILLIAVSMYIYNASQDTIGQAGNSMNQQAKSAYNSEIESYLGESKNSNDVKALIQAVINSNNSHIDEPGKFISIGYTNLSGDGKTGYKIEMKKVGEDGKLEATATDCAGEIGNQGSNSNNETYVKTTTNAMSSLKGKIKSNNKYKCEADYEAGIITKVTITDK